MKKLLMTIILLTMTLSAGSHFSANFSLVDSEADFDLDLSAVIPVLGDNTYYLGVGAMGIGEDPSTGDAINTMYSVRAFMQTELNPFDDITLELGLKAIYSEINGNTFLALPLGVNVWYIMPGETMHPIIRGTFFYGPAHLALADAKDYLEYRVGVGLQMDNIRQVFESTFGTMNYFHVFLEYRSINTNFNAMDLVLNETFYLGAKFAF